jgi:hypothetical protein
MPHSYPPVPIIAAYRDRLLPQTNILVACRWCDMLHGHVVLDPWSDNLGSRESQCTHPRFFKGKFLDRRAPSRYELTDPDHLIPEAAVRRATYGYRESEVELFEDLRRMRFIRAALAAANQLYEVTDRINADPRRAADDPYLIDEFTRALHNAVTTAVKLKEQLDVQDPERRHMQSS